VQRLPLAGLAGVETAEPSARRLARHALVGFPLNVVAFAVAGYIWLLLPMNWGFPLRGTDDASLQASWGGPSLAGAWVVHAVGATLEFLLVGLPILAGVTALQVRLARRLLVAGAPTEVPDRPS
jgi:hypothetical protein